MYVFVYMDIEHICIHMYTCIYYVSIHVCVCTCVCTCVRDKYTFTTYQGNYCGLLLGYMFPLHSSQLMCFILVFQIYGTSEIFLTVYSVKIRNDFCHSLAAYGEPLGNSPH